MPSLDVSVQILEMRLQTFDIGSWGGIYNEAIFNGWISPHAAEKPQFGVSGVLPQVSGAPRICTDGFRVVCPCIRSLHLWYRYLVRNSRADSFQEWLACEVFDLLGKSV